MSDSQTPEQMGQGILLRHAINTALTTPLIPASEVTLESIVARAKIDGDFAERAARDL